MLEIAKNFNFLKCDKVASKCNLNPNSSYRIRTGIRETIKELCNQTGDSYIIVNNNFIALANEKLKYYLCDEDIKAIKEELKNKPDMLLFDYNVFNFFYNTIDIKELLQFINRKEKYLFFETEYQDILTELKKSDNKFTVINDKVYLTELYNAEQIISDKVISFINNKKGKNKKVDLEKQIEIYENRNSITLNQQQKDAILKILESKTGGFYILTGAAGTGKTTVVDAIVNINNNLKKHFFINIAAPTGKAVKVIKDSLSVYAEVNTIHRMLGYDGNEFAYVPDVPLAADFIIVDETSMLDLELASRLLSAIRDDCKVLFLGDEKQLPSIGPGKVLKDLIECVPQNVLKLTKICRQKNGSGIIENSDNILKEKMIKTAQTKDNYVLWEHTNNDFNKRLLQAIDYYKNKCGFTNDEIQILTPMRIGILGTYQLNKFLQQKFNPNGYSLIDIEEYTDIPNFTPNKFKVGDKVINVRNNYTSYKYDQPINTYNIDSYIIYCTNIKIREDKINKLTGKIKSIGVANGDSGYITDIFKTKIPIFDQRGRYRGDKDANCITVQFDDGYMCFIDSTDLRLGYAISIHKSQGSGWKGIISLIGPGHQRMACNELIYVANTRAREQNIFLGSYDIYKNSICIHLNDRNTTLVQRFKKNKNV